MANSQSLLARLLNATDLPAVVPRLRPDVLHRVIEACGLEDSSELVSHATPAQLARVFDLDLWRARAPGGVERFDADRFGVWLAVLLEAGPDIAAGKLAGLDIELIAEGLSQHVVVSDHAAVAPYTTLDGEQVAGRPSGRAHAANIAGYAIDMRRASAWDAIVELLTCLAAEHGEYFHRLMRACVRLSNGAREEDPSHRLLDDAEQHLFDLAADREARREREGYVTPEQAHALLRVARDLTLNGDRPERSVIARAYFRAFEPVVPERTDSIAEEISDRPGETVLQVLRGAGVLTPPPRALLEAGDPATVRLEWIASHVVAHPESAEELAYLANALIAGCSVQGRRFVDREAGDAVLATCNLGLENWPTRWPDRDLLTAFQVGWTILRRDACVYAATRLIEILAVLTCADRDTFLALGRLRRDLVRHLAQGEPWRARGSLDVILTFDAPAWAGLVGLISECPVLHAALDAGNRQSRTINPTDFTFIARNRDLATVRRFLDGLTNVLSIAG